MALRSSDDLNQLITDKLDETGSLTSDELFDLAKPYYELTDSKSELSQWARARIANLRKKRRVWPTAHMVYGTVKGKAATGDFDSLSDMISADEFYESPRTVYWSWDFGLAKHDLERVGRKPSAVTPITPRLERREEGVDNGARAFSMDGVATMHDHEGAAVASAAAAAAFSPTAMRLPSFDDGTVQFASVGGRDGIDDVVSPTREIRGSLTATHISSPKRKPSYDGGVMESPSKRRTPHSSTSEQPGAAFAAVAAAAAVAAVAESSGMNDFNDDDGEVWDDDEEGDGEYDDPSSSSNPESSNKLLLLAAAAQLELPESPDQANGASPNVSRKGSKSRSSSTSPRRSIASQHRGSKYKCGKCGFFPKSTPHSCKTRTARVSKGKSESPERSPSPDTEDSPRYQSRPKQYACGKCGFFPKSGAHSCKTATAIDTAALATSPRRKNYRRTPNPSTPIGEGRPRQYRCGKCGFFPKAMRHDCETGKAYTSAGSPAKSPSKAKGSPKSARKSASSRSQSSSSMGGAGGIDLDLDTPVDSVSEAAAASILSMATSSPRHKKAPSQ